ncbi:hypothetical protein GW884_01695 [Candidatus Falkowbacteria bacterium]|nr:hypothetical protein [Candidatus Falkowbacteria bacterium]
MKIDTKLDWSKIANYFYVSRKSLKEISRYLLGLLYVRIYLLIALTLNLLNWLLVYYFNASLSQNLVILHYNVNLGVNLIGEAGKIYTIPLLGLIFMIFNFILLLNIYQEGKFVIHLLLATTAVVNLILIISTASLYLINFR